MSDPHSLHSSSREKIVEHLLVGEILKRLWQRGVADVEVLRSEVDSSGYDIVMEHANVVRHVQLKSSFYGSSTGRQNVSVKLRRKPSGCVVWIVFDRNTLDLGPFFWFGGAPGEALPEIEHLPAAKHTKGNAEGVKGERPNIRVISRNQFQKLNTVDDLIDALFGADQGHFGPSPGRTA